MPYNLRLSNVVIEQYSRCRREALGTYVIYLRTTAKAISTTRRGPAPTQNIPAFVTPGPYPARSHGRVIDKNV